MEDLDLIQDSDNIVISVCMLTYMHEEFIAQAIAGVLSQQFNGTIEFVISEDHGIDPTRAICRDFQKRYPNLIRLILPDRNLGMSANFIQALRKCRGRYIALCEGDDYWTDPLKLQKQVDVLESDPTLAGCFHHSQQIFEESGAYGRMFGGQQDGSRITTLDTMRSTAPFHTASFVFRRSALVLPSWFAKVGSPDMALFTLVSLSGDLALVPEVMSTYRKHIGGITMTSRYRSVPFHFMRINLWLHLDQFTHYRQTARCKELFLEHWVDILKRSTPRGRFRYLMDLFLATPMWFIRNPLFSLRRLREALRR
jgi:glycosyltransferase involved in cell wall biosynthesis